MKFIKDRKRRVTANTDVAPEAADLLFEVDDVAQLVAEITGEDVEVTADATEVTFEISGDQYDSFTIEAEGDEEIVEESVRNKKTKGRIAASMNKTRKVTASMNRNRKPAGKIVKRFANKK